MKITKFITFKSGVTKCFTPEALDIFNTVDDDRSSENVRQCEHVELL